MAIRRIILLLLLVMSTAMNECKAWQPKPYKAYLIDLQCQQDSVVPSSVMALRNHPKQKVDTKNFQCGPYWVTPPIPVVEQVWGYDEMNEPSTSFAGFVFETLTNGIISAFFN